MSPAAAGPPPSLTGVRVFLAEDEPMILWAFEEALGDLGCQVVGTAALVTEALAFVATHGFDVAVLDARLIDGDIDPVIDVLAAGGTPFILASGLVQPGFTERFSSAVALQKPYDIADLEHAIARVLQRG
jgi:CheY-like chemotaxis protein